MNRSLPGGEENVRRFLQKIAADKPYNCCGQPHDTHIEIISEPGFYENADGLITKGDYVLGVKTADCVPLLLYELSTKTIGAIHISRDILIAGIISRSLSEALKKADVSPLSTKFFLGPHIRVESYPQKKEKAEKIAASRFKKFLTNYNDKTCFDLTAAVIYELEEIGASRDNIIDCALDTYCDKRFYSARRLKKGEKLHCFLSVIFK